LRGVRKIELRALIVPEIRNFLGFPGLF
jgi:hypothetical protein